MAEAEEKAQARVPVRDLMAVLADHLAEAVSTSPVAALRALSQNPVLPAQAQEELRALAKAVLRAQKAGREVTVEITALPPTGALVFRMI